MCAPSLALTAGSPVRMCDGLGDSTGGLKAATDCRPIAHYVRTTAHASALVHDNPLWPSRRRYVTSFVIMNLNPLTTEQQQKAVSHQLKVLAQATPTLGKRRSRRCTQPPRASALALRKMPLRIPYATPSLAVAQRQTPTLAITRPSLTARRTALAFRARQSLTISPRSQWHASS